MVAHHLERTRHVVEDSGSVMGYVRRFAMHQFPRAHDLSAVSFPNGLVAETNAEDWNRGSPAANCRDADSRFGRSAWAGRNHHPFHPQCTDFFNRNFIVALHHGSLT